jgi:hypothetical protein
MRTALLFFILTCQLCTAAPVNEPKAIGEWSEPTNGLRGRLIFYSNGITDRDGVVKGLVYLELQNLPPGDTLYVYYAVGRMPLKCELRDFSGKSIEESRGAGSDFMPAACWLALPPDSTLRFRTGYSSSAPDFPCLFIISAFIGGKWHVPMTATNDYYLSGTFSSISTTNGTRPRVWEGTLKLPPVRIEAKSQ